MKFVDVIKREKTITIDGYSDAKTIKGAISDIGRYIAKHIDEWEGNIIRESKEEALLSAKDSEGGYFLEVEEVGCASRYNEKTEKMEYKDANFYVVCRIVR